MILPDSESEESKVEEDCSRSSFVWLSREDTELRFMGGTWLSHEEEEKVGEELFKRLGLFSIKRVSTININRPFQNYPLIFGQT